MTDDDRDLISAFESLRNERQVLPSVAQLTTPAGRRRHHARRMASAALLAALIAIPALLAYQNRRQHGFDYDRFTALTGIDLGAVTWTAPSDFLLDTPGTDLRGSPLTQTSGSARSTDSAQSKQSNDTGRRSRS